MNGRVKRISFSERSGYDELFIDFPGGSVSVARRPDGQGWWAHITRDRRANTGEPDAVVTDARIDGEHDYLRGRVTDIAVPGLYHIAVCIKPGGGL